MYRVLKAEGVAIIHELRRDAPEAALASFNKSRAAAGIGASTRTDKYTVDELRQFVCRAGVSNEYAEGSNRGICQYWNGVAHQEDFELEGVGDGTSVKNRTGYQGKLDVAAL